MPYPPPADGMGFPEASILALVAEGDEVVYRFLGRAHPRQIDFQSDQERNRPFPPKGWWIDHLGVSTWRSAERASRIAQRFPLHLAELRLPAGPSTYLAETYEPGHLTIWADSEALPRAVTTVYRRKQQGAALEVL